MKAKTRRSLCFVVIAVLVLSSGVRGVHAVGINDIQSLIDNDPTRNLSQEGLLTIDDAFASLLEKPEDEIITPDTVVLGNSRASGNPTGQTMTSAQYQQIENAALIGDVLITKDSTSFGVQHGHAGIVYFDQTTVEALGYGTLSQLQDLSTWASQYQVRLYRPDTNSISRNKAGTYAKNYLRGWTYQLQPAVDSNANLNCATLVWQAYKYGTGIEFPYNSVGSLIPQNMVEWWGMSQVVSVNWSGTGW